MKKEARFGPRAERSVQSLLTYQLTDERGRDLPSSTIVKNITACIGEYLEDCIAGDLNYSPRVLSTVFPGLIRGVRALGQDTGTLTAFQKECSTSTDPQLLLTNFFDKVQPTYLGKKPEKIPTFEAKKVDENDEIATEYIYTQGEVLRTIFHINEAVKKHCYQPFQSFEVTRVLSDVENATMVPLPKRMRIARPLPTSPEAIKIEKVEVAQTSQPRNEVPKRIVKSKTEWPSKVINSSRLRRTIRETDVKYRAEWKVANSNGKLQILLEKGLLSSNDVEQLSAYFNMHSEQLPVASFSKFQMGMWKI